MTILLSYHDTVTPFMSRQCHSFYVVTMLLLLRHDNVTPFYVMTMLLLFTSWQCHSFYVTTMLLLFTSWQYYSLAGRFFSLGVPACNSPLEESASDYSSSLVLLEVSPADYSFRMPIVGQNRLLLFWSPAASLVCHWSVYQVGGRGLLRESLLLRHLKGCFISETEIEGAR